MCQQRKSLASFVLAAFVCILRSCFIFSVALLLCNAHQMVTDELTEAKSTTKTKTQVNAATGAIEVVEVTTAASVEPVYCYCRRGAFGEMIGCESDECVSRWCQ